MSQSSDKSIQTKPSDLNALIFVLTTVGISAVGFGIIIPVLPELILELTGSGNENAALHIGWLVFTYAFMQFLFNPLFGALSDAFGRRTVMLSSLAGLSIDYFIIGLAPTIAFLYIGRLIAGAMGATFATANAFIADISPPETRSQNFGLIGAAFGLGFALGPAIGGLLADPTYLGNLASSRLPFFAAGILGLLNLIYGFYFLPETLSAENRRPVEWARATPIGAIKAIGRVKGVHGLLIVFLLMGLANTAYPSVFAISMIERFDWSTGTVGLAFATFGLVSFMTQGGLIRIIIPKIGQFWSAIIAIITMTMAYFCMGAAVTGWVIFATCLFSGFSSLSGPSVNGMMSVRVSASEQGELQGAIGTVNSLGMMLGPLCMSTLFYQFTRDGGPAYIPGAPFYLASALTALSLITLIMVATKSDRQHKSSVVDKS